MSIFRANPLLVAIVALLFAVGYGEQIFGQFVRHHHEMQTHADADADDHEDGDHHHDDSDKKKDDNHRLEHLAAIGTVPPAVLSVIVNLQQTGLVETSAASRVEAPVRGIEHPPQLA